MFKSILPIAWVAILGVLVMVSPLPAAAAPRPAKIFARVLGKCGRYYKRTRPPLLTGVEQTVPYSPYRYPCLIQVSLKNASGAPLSHASFQMVGEGHVFGRGITGEDGTGTFTYPLQVTVPGFITNFQVQGPLNDRRALTSEFQIY